jgi:putative endonuclease
MTNNLHRRVFQEKNDRNEGFTKEYKCHRLVHWESFDDVRNAINREKEIKGWRRSKKVALIEETNPTWEDLAADWYEERVPRRYAPRDDTRLRLGEQARSAGSASEQQVPRCAWDDTKSRNRQPRTEN